MEKSKHIAAHSLATLLLSVTLLLNPGCTRNNGDIGRWFGNWQIMEISTDGVPDPGYEPRYFMEFQNNIVKLIWVGPNGYDRQTYTCFGTWSQPSDNTMMFDFTHSDDDGTPIYNPFSALHFPSDEIFNTTISDISGKHCTMKFVDASTSKEYTYRLQKR